MALLTINAVAVECSDFTEQEPERVGATGRAWDGGLWSQVRAEKRVWSATTDYLTASEIATLRAAVALDAAVSVVQNIDGVTISARVRVNEVKDHVGTSAGMLRRAALLIREV